MYWYLEGRPCVYMGVCVCMCGQTSGSWDGVMFYGGCY